MIKAIIFDCFGVLVTSSYEPFKQKYFGNDQSLIDEFMWIENRSSRGEITLEEADIEFARIAQISPEQAATELSRNPRNAQLLDYINELKKDYKIGMLSNVADDRLSELFNDEDIAAFDDIVLSYQVGLAKPDERIYRLSAQRLDMDPEDCLFIDDNSSYCVGARLVGMRTILYEDFEQFKRQLEESVA